MYPYLFECDYCGKQETTRFPSEWVWWLDADTTCSCCGNVTHGTEHEACCEEHKQLWLKEHPERPEAV